MPAVPMPQERIFSCVHGEVAALTWGDAGKPCLLMLHGWLDNAASFTRLAPLFTSHHVIALDLPGHGHSAPLHVGASYYIWDYVEVIHQVLLQLPTPVTILGHSMGGVSALILSATFPEQVARLVLLDSLGPFVGADHEMTVQLRKGIEQSLRRSQQRQSQSVVYSRIEDAINARIKVDTRLQGDEIAPVVERNLLRTEQGWCWRTDPRLRDASKVRLTEPMVRGVLQQVLAPCLLLRAEFSIIPDAWFADRAACLSDARSKVMLGHHHFHLQGGALPALFAAVKEFLDESI